MGKQPENMVYAGIHRDPRRPASAESAQRLAQLPRGIEIADQHLFLDSSLPTHDAAATALCLRRSREFLDRVS